MKPTDSHRSAASVALAGRVLSVTGSADAEAIVITDGRVSEVGSRELLVRAEQRGVPTRDYGHQVIVPGFVDPHIHLELLATALHRAVDVRVPRCKTIGEVLGTLSAAVSGVVPGGWLLAYGNLFFDQKLAERRLPTRAELDEVSADVPIQLACGGHTSVLNSAALRLAGVDRFLNGAAGLWGSPVVQLGDDGKPTGVVSEIDQMLPVPHLAREQLEASLASTYFDLFTRFGVTTFGEMLDSLETADIFDDLIASGQVPARGVLYPLVPSAAPLQEAVEWTAAYRSRSGTDRLRAAGIKMFADGGYSARNAATRTPYVAEHAPRSGYRGRLNLTQGDIKRALDAAREHGIQLAVHANGTRAQDEVVDALLTSPGPHDHPAVRVEHAGNLVNERADLARFRSANVIPVLQPVFLYNFMADFVPMLLGDAGTRGRLPLRDMLDDGLAPAASSDVGPGAEDEQSNPLFSIWECMARRSYWGLHIEPEQGIGFAEALRMHTIDAARSMGVDDVVGSLEPGKVGDVVVLDRDPRVGGLDSVRQAKVDAVYVDGSLVHSRESSS